MSPSMRRIIVSLLIGLSAGLGVRLAYPQETYSDGVVGADVLYGPNPATSTDNAIPRWDGTGARRLKNSVVIIDDSGNITGALALTLSGLLSGSTGQFSGLLTLNGGATLPVGDALLSEATATGFLAIRLNNSLTTGLGIGGSVNTVSVWVANTERFRWQASGSVALVNTGLAPFANGTDDLGVNGQGFDDLIIDDVYLRRVTATEGRIHGQGVVGFDELQIMISNVSGQYDSWDYTFAPAPNNVASVRGMNVSSEAVGVKALRGGAKGAYVPVHIDNGYRIEPRLTVNSDCPITLTTESILLHDNTGAGAACVVNLPDASTVGRGFLLTVKHIGTVAQAITLTPTASDGIEGGAPAATRTMNGGAARLREQFITDGVDAWWLVN